MKTILITGCAGFIGSNLSKILLDKGNIVIGIDNFDIFYDKKIKQKNLEILHFYSNFVFFEIDILDVSKLFSIESNIDIVIHLAAKAGVLPSLKNPDSYIKVNISGTNNILEFIKEKRINKFLFASSSSVYGNSKKFHLKKMKY